MPFRIMRLPRPWGIIRVMIIERIWSANAYRNFHYLIACPETRRGARRGPAGVAALPRRCQGQRLDRSHRSSTRTSTGITLAAMPGSSAPRARRCWPMRVPRAASAAWTAGCARATSSGSAARSSWSAWIRPGHTHGAHLPVLAHGPAGAVLRRHAVQCRRRQLPRRRASGALYDTFATQLARLPDSTRVYPGHEYLARNLEFTLDREPDNGDAARDAGRAGRTIPRHAVSRRSRRRSA